MKKEIKISIIVTARNYSKYLGECLQSCLNQNVEPFEVIYSDDFSEDNSIEVASKFTDNIVKHKKHVGVVIARNNGVARSKGNVLVHVDGDDLLPIDYLERHLEVFDETTPFVYGAANAFGTKSVFWRVYTWKDLNIWDRNFVNTSAMIWKDKFLEAGGWMETDDKTMWDWSLALRLSRLGEPKKSNAILQYRQHDNSWSELYEKAGNYSNFINIIDSVRKQTVKMSVGLVYSGRLPGLMKEWMKSLIEDVSILRHKPEFIIINNSGERIDFIEEIHYSYFPKIKIITGIGKYVYNTEQERRNKVCELLSECYNIILENSTGELIHLREDDIIPEKGSFNKIYEFITTGVPVKAAAAGVYLNRNIKTHERFVGGFYNIRQPLATVDIDKIHTTEPMKVDFTGTGFLIFWKRICPLFKPYIDGIQAHDWAWSLKLKQMGQELFMLPEAKCKHYNDENNYIIPKITPNINGVNQEIKRFRTVRN
jgi:glycosyltransferase involved in cell wall biosynthesis